MRELLLLVAAVVITGCASGDTSVARSPPPAQSVAAGRATQGTTSVAVSERAEEGSETAAAPFVPPAGYHRRIRNGKTVFCKTETPVGTRFSRQYCFTEEELERIEANRRNVQREVDRARRNCVAAGSYCGGD